MNDKPALVKNAADPKQVEKGKRKEKTARDRELNDVRYILSDIRGRRYLWGRLESAHMFETSMTGNSQTFFNEGERNQGLKILTDIMEASPEAYLLMMKEAKQQQLNETEPEPAKKEDESNGD